MAVIGGCGQVGLPLAIALADRGAHVVIYDVSEAAVAAVSAARMPFARPGAALPLERAVAVGRLAASADPRIVRGAEHVIIASASDPPQPASPPRPGRGRHAAAPRGPRGPRTARAPWAHGGSLRDGQILILRSAARPGTTAQLEQLVAELGMAIDVAFCPERAPRSRAMPGVSGAPQIAAGSAPAGCSRG